MLAELELKFSKRPLFKKKILCLVVVSSLLYALFHLYSMGLPGEFFFDDYPNIVDARYVKISDISVPSLIKVAKSGNSGPFGRPIATLSFAIDYYFWGLSPDHYKKTNIVIHLLNTIFLFIFLRFICYRFFKAKNQVSKNKALIISLIGAFLWGAHPLHVSTVLYIVQRMALLSTTFCLISLIVYSYARNEMIKEKALVGIRPFKSVSLLSIVMLFMGLSILSKENGLVTIALLFLTEIIVFNFFSVSRFDKNLLIIFYLVFLVIPALYFLGSIGIEPHGLIRGYDSREFSFVERVLTQPRILWHYIKWIIIPNTYDLGFYHDDIVISKSFFNPLTTIFSVVSILFGFLISMFFVIKKKYLPFSYAILWFLLAHSLESSIFPLEMVFEHRNYLPSIGFFIGLVIFLVRFFDTENTSLLKPFLIFAIFFSTYYAISVIRCDRWSNDIKRSSSWVANHPNSARSNYDLALSYAKAVGFGGDDEFAEKAINYYLRSASANGKNQGALLSLIVFASNNNLSIKNEWTLEAKKRLAKCSVQPNIASQFNAMFKCINDGHCNLDKEFEELISITLSNTNIGSGTLGHLYAIRGMHYFLNLGDLSRAQADFNKAIELGPREIDYRFLLARLYKKQGDRKKAILYLQKIANEIFFSIYNDEIYLEIDRLALGDSN